MGYFGKKILSNTNNSLAGNMNFTGRASTVTELMSGCSLIIHGYNCLSLGKSIRGGSWERHHWGNQESLWGFKWDIPEK